MKKNLWIIILIALIVIAGAIFLSEKQNEHTNQSEPIDSCQVPEVKLVWGFPQDSITIDTFSITRNQNLSDILYHNGVSARNVDALAKNSKSIFDVRRIKLGNNYYLIHTDTVSSPSHFIYEESPTDYVVFELGDSLNVYRGSKPIQTVTKSISGEIATSLWNAMTDQGANPVLSLDLSDIFAWTIDFFGIQKGDRFKAIYDEHFVDSTSIGLGRISVALFENMGEPVYAFYFNDGGQEGYFDMEGKSLKKAFLKAPLSYSRISSRFSNSRMHPVLKYRRPHHGVDYAAPSGTPVYSIGEGVVVKKGYQSTGGGNYLSIKHNSVYTSQYMHLRGYAKGLSNGVRVKQGQLIGYVGMTGLASGPHLDFRIFKNGTAVDPLKVKSPPVEPIKPENVELFTQLKDSLMKCMDQIPFPSSSKR